MDFLAGLKVARVRSKAASVGGLFRHGRAEHDHPAAVLVQYNQ
jgi:hypothetical protein